jgi:hypothetical protein
LRREREDEDLARILASPATREALTRCDGRLTVPDSRPRPLSAYLLERAPATIEVAARASAVRLSYATAAARDAYAIGTPSPPPVEATRVAANRSWRVSTSNC